MLYLLAIVFPPGAIFLCDKPLQAILNFILATTSIGWLFAILHAIFVVNARKADKRTEWLISVLKN